MLAGASGIDFALFVVAADDGVKPQTLEHLAIIDLLGVKARPCRHHEGRSRRRPNAWRRSPGEIRAAAAGTVLEGADILPVSALTGQGVDDP